jgi:RimJ/RimL family protein N-acetyltransferase
MENGNVKIRYQFEKLKKTDLEWFLGIRNSARQFLHNSREYSQEECELWWETEELDYRTIIFEEKKIGYFRIGRIEKFEGSRLLWIGCDLDEKYRHQGHGFGAYKTLMPELLKEFQVDGFVLRVRPNNIQAIKLYLKLGFELADLDFKFIDQTQELLINDILLSWCISNVPEKFLELVYKS